MALARPSAFWVTMKKATQKFRYNIWTSFRVVQYLYSEIFTPIKKTNTCRNQADHAEFWPIKIMRLRPVDFTLNTGTPSTGSIFEICRDWNEKITFRVQILKNHEKISKKILPSQKSQGIHRYSKIELLIIYVGWKRLFFFKKSSISGCLSFNNFTLNKI